MKMTNKEFDKTRWMARMVAEYDDSEWLVAFCDFETRTIGLIENGERVGDPLEVPCAEVTILDKVAEKEAWERVREMSS
jgi:hypothetical protein